MPVQASNHQKLFLAVDSVIFSVQDNQLNALMIQMQKKPYTNKWAFPGGIIKQNETTEVAARRILKEQAGVSDVYLEQLATFDDPKRDPFGRVVSVAYFALVPANEVKLQDSSKFNNVTWWPVNNLPELAYDHKKIAKTALERLRAKLEYSNVAYSLLPKEFTLSDLQGVYESILGRKLDKRNFRRKILSLDIILPSGNKVTGKSHRPAALYKFKDQKLVYVDIL